MGIASEDRVAGDSIAGAEEGSHQAFGQAAAVATCAVFLQSVDMRGLILFGALIMTAAAAGPSLAAERGADSASVFATVGHSEWCPQGNVRLDLGTGRYRVTAPATWRTCRRPAFRSRLRMGLLPADQLAAVREAYRAAMTRGLERRDCRVVISNGGTPVLRITRGGQTVAAPQNEGCWSESALRLHDVLERLFDPRR